MDYNKLKYEVLRQFWGYKNFRNLQENIIDSISFKNDTLCLLPTGGGKSICYQLPALITEGVCIVISPLLALMKDQVERLQSIGIEAEFISSELDDTEIDTIYSRCRSGITKLLYVSPERLTNTKFINEANEIPFSFIAVDEAHCISEWGQDFRPSYKNIKDFKEMFQLSCIALTATATPTVEKEIIEKLGLKNCKIFKKGFKRDNININILKISDKFDKIYNYLNLNKTSGLIYVNTRQEAVNLSQFLRSKGLNNVDYYHAGLSKKEKEKKQKWWQESNLNTLISTNAFGMGIDKENVSFVIHLNPPYSIENYYQEIGRAGRNGQPSYAFLLWNEQDLTKSNDILKSQFPNQKEYKKIITSLYSMYQIADYEYIDKEFQFDVKMLQRRTNCTSGKIKSVLEFLHLQEIIYLRNRNSPSSIELLIPYNEIENLPPSDAYFLELLLRNIIGLTTQKTHFQEDKLANKLNIDKSLIKERIIEMMNKNYIEYIDGDISSIRFLHPRDERRLLNSYWSDFKTIQFNKIKKWEEFKYFITNEDFCKMKLILHYFGEKTSSNCNNCNNCNICNSKKPSNHCSEKEEIIKILRTKPATKVEIGILLSHCSPEKIEEHLIDLLNDGKITIKDFRTYMIK